MAHWLVEKYTINHVPLTDFTNRASDASNGVAIIQSLWARLLQLPGMFISLVARYSRGSNTRTPKHPEPSITDLIPRGNCKPKLVYTMKTCHQELVGLFSQTLYPPRVTCESANEQISTESLLRSHY